MIFLKSGVLEGLGKVAGEGSMARPQTPAGVSESREP